MYTDTLAHYKYIKKEFKKGKWRYIYPNDKLGIKSFANTRITGEAYKQHADESMSEAQQYFNQAHDPSVKGNKNKVNDLRQKQMTALGNAKSLTAKYQNESLKGVAEKFLDSGKQVIGLLAGKIDGKSKKKK